MILEMRRALEELGKGENQGYRKLYNATYEDVYCRNLLILQNEKQAVDFMETFYTALFENVGDLAIPEQPERWFWQKYYQEMRKVYHHLLSAQVKGQHCGKSSLAAVPAALPLLHRILLMMSLRDEFSEKEISEIFGLAEEKVETELGKVKTLLPNLTKNQPESAAVYTGDWRVLIAAAFRQVLTAESDQWVDSVYEHAANAAGIKAEDASAKADDFDYFVADVEVEPETPKKKKEAPVVEEPEEDEEDDYDVDDEDDEDEEDDYDVDDEDDDEDEDEDEDDDEEDDRYDWDLEDDNRKMVIVGVILAIVIIAVVGFGVKTFLDKSKGNGAAVSTEQEAEDDQEGDAELVIRGDGDSSSDDSSETEDQQEEETDASSEETTEEEQPAEEAESAEPETVNMKVTPSSVNVRSEASTDSSIVTKVKSGEIVEVLGDITQEWVQIRCTSQDGKEGYVKSEFLAAAE